MLLRKYLILFFRLPAAVMLCSNRCVTPLYCSNKAQPQVHSSRRLLIYLPLWLCVLLSFHTAKAQVDSSYVDTISMQHIEAPVTDSVAAAEESTGYDDQDDGYVDTSIKHIYDTSQFFFNWKSFYTDTFSSKKITPRHLIDAEAKALKQQDDFWYIPAIESQQQRLETDKKFRDSLLKKREHALEDASKAGITYQPWFNTLLWIIIIGIFAAAIIYFLVQNKINIFSSEAAAVEEEASAGTGEDIFSLSYTKLIQQAEKNENFRIAIRLMFLQTLRSLSDTGAIQYQPDYTDLHYLQQLSQSKYYTDFFTVMRSYEYAWYGKFFISPERYAAIKKDFLTLQNKIR